MTKLLLPLLAASAAIFLSACETTRVVERHDHDRGYRYGDSRRDYDRGYDRDHYREGDRGYRSGRDYSRGGYVRDNNTVVVREQTRTVNSPRNYNRSRTTYDTPVGDVTVRRY